MRHQGCCGRVRASLAALFVIGGAHADGFFDQGFVQAPVVRTDYVGTNAGTSLSPLRISDCHFGQDPCPTLNSVFSQSNAWNMNWPGACLPGYNCPNFWTLTLNDEAANSLSNSGPPDVSQPHAWPGFGMMGFNALYGDDNFPGDVYWRAHLVLNFGFPDPQFAGNPFLAFGAFAGHGNGTRLGALNPSPSTVPSVLEFDARLWSSTLPEPVWEYQQSTIVFWFQVFANWGPYPKAIQIALFHQASAGYLATPTLATIPWDWRYMDSAYFPGAIFVSSRAEDLRGYCGMNVPSLVLQQDVHYSIDLQQLFRCMSDHGLFVDGQGNDEPLPTTGNIPITIVNWANEGTGVNGSLWTDVHNMRMTSMHPDPIFGNDFD